MNALLADLVPALGWALVDFLWQGAVVGALAWALLALLRDARPQARYAVGLAALAACIAWPLLTVVASLGADSAEVAATASAPFALPFDAGAAGATDGGDWRGQLQARLPQLVTAWSLGAALLALRFALGVAWVGRLRQAGSLPGFDWQSRLERLAAAVGLANPPSLRLVDGLEGPAVAGWWRPVVLLPTALLTRMPADFIEALVAHELAHVRRHDYLVNLLQGVVESLLFYHPVVWWLSRGVRVEREQIADDLALRAIPDPRRLALALQALDRLQAAATASAPLPHLAPAAHGGQLMNRIRRLVRPQRAGLHWKSSLPLLAVVTLCAAVVAQATPSSTAPAPVAAPAAAVASQPASSTVAASAVATAPAVAPVAAAAPVAAPAPAAALAPAAAIAITSGDDVASAETPDWSARRGQPYALVREDREGMMLSGDMADVAEVKRLRQHVHGDFLWFRRGGAAYVVQDPAVLAEVRAAWADAEAIAARLDALSKQMEPHSRKMEALGQQMERLAEADRPQREQMEALAQRMEPLADQQRALAEKMRALGERLGEARGEDERERLSRQMEALSAKMEPLNAQMQALGAQMSAQGERMRSQHAPMERLGERMNEASKPMHALGEQMGMLGKQQERLARQADGKVQALIERALREGKAERSARLMAR